MLKKSLSLAAMTLIGMMPALAEITPLLSPDPQGEVSDLATIKVTFDGLEYITKPKLATISATLVNETTDTKYVCVAVNYSFSEMNAATLAFGVEGSSEALGEIKDDGSYKLTIGAGSFKSEETYPDTYYSPLIEAEYTIGGEEKDAMSVYTITPSAGAVTEIGSIKIDFPETGIMGINVKSTEGITLSYNNGVESHVATVVKQEFAWGSDCSLLFDWEDATVKEPMTFIAPGTYTLDIPEGAFTDFFGSLSSRHITARFTIEAMGGSMSKFSISPASGEVSELGTIGLTFGGNEITTLQFAEDLSGITITRKGDHHTVWHCNGASASYSTASLTFAREGSEETSLINAPGEYLLSVPAGVVSGYTAEGRKWNDAAQALYVITTGVNNMTEYTISPAADAVLMEVGNVEITFEKVQDGISYPSDLSAVTMTFTPAGDAATEAEAMETYSPKGCRLEGNTITLLFGDDSLEPFTADGEYVLTIPEGTFGEEGNPASSSPAIAHTFVVNKILSGAGEIIAGEKSATIYNLQGVAVRAAGDKRPLPAGLYISAGRIFRVR